MNSRRNLLKIAVAAPVAAGGLMMASGASANTTASTFFDIRNYDKGAGDTAAIQSAVDAAFVAGGGVVYIPAGTYRVKQIRIKRNVTIMGEGMGTILDQDDSVDKPVIATANADSYPVAVQSLRIIGSSSGGRNAHGIYLASESTGAGFTVPDGEHLISDLFIVKTGGDGIHIKKDCRGTSIRGVWTNKCRSGFRIEGSDSTIAECVARGSSGAGFSINGGNTRLVNCKAFFNQAGGFSSTSSRALFFACEAQDNWNFGFALSANYPTITGCLADSNQYYGFWLKGASGYLAGVNMTGATAIGRNTSQAGKPWTGQKYGIGVVSTNLRDSILSGLARDNCTANFISTRSEIESSVNRSMLVEGRLATFCG